MDSIRVVIADNLATVRKGIRQLLLREADFKIVAEVAHESRVGEAVDKWKPDVLLLAQFRPHEGDALRTLREKNPRTAILILDEGWPEERLLEYIKAGAKGLISRSETADVLAKAIRVVAAGEIWAGRKMLTQVIEELATPPAPADRLQGILESRLTRRELRIAERVAQGCSNREIAEQLRISEKTVKNHLSSIFQKLRLQNRTQLTAFILRHRGA